MDDKQPALDEALLKRRQKLFGIISIVVIVLLIFGLGYLIGKPLIMTLRNKESFRSWIEAQGALKYFIMMGMMILQIIIAVIPGGPIEVAAGYAFGPWMGTLVCMLGSVLGSALVFWLARRYGMKLVRIFVPEDKLDNIKLLQSKGKLNTALFIVFLVPGMPKDILTYLAGLTPVSMSNFLIITSIARLPAVLLSAMGGHNFGQRNFRAVGLIIAVGTVLGILLVYLYRLYTKRKESESPVNDQANDDKEEADV